MAHKDEQMNWKVEKKDDQMTSVRELSWCPLLLCRKGHMPGS
jgi:hypothetical protein